MAANFGLNPPYTVYLSQCFVASVIRGSLLMEALYFALGNLTVAGLILWFAYAEKRPDAQSKGPFGMRSLRKRRSKTINLDEPG